MEKHISNDKEIFEAVVQVRDSAIKADAMDEKVKDEDALSAGIKSVFTLAENCPDLQVSDYFIELKNEIGAVEDGIHQSKEGYNKSARDLNEKRETFPYSTIATITRIKRLEYFEMESE